MNQAAVRVATAAVRAWTRLYTWGLPTDACDARRQEIESDLWESTHEVDTDGALPAQDIWMRLAGGLVDDVRWRAAQDTHAGPYAFRVGITLGLATVIALWMVNAATLPAGQPRPPVPPRLDVTPVLARQPPPPPPPPCLPPSFKQDPGFRCLR